MSTREQHVEDTRVYVLTQQLAGDKNLSPFARDAAADNLRAAQLINGSTNEAMIQLKQIHIHNARQIMMMPEQIRQEVALYHADNCPLVGMVTTGPDGKKTIKFPDQAAPIQQVVQTGEGPSAITISLKGVTATGDASKIVSVVGTIVVLLCFGISGIFYYQNKTARDKMFADVRAIMQEQAADTRETRQVVTESASENRR